MEHLKNISIGPRYAVRLEDLGTWDRFEASCLACRHKKVLHPDIFRRRWPGYTRVIELEKKLRCESCGNREGNSLKIGRLKRD